MAHTLWMAQAMQNMRSKGEGRMMRGRPRQDEGPLLQHVLQDAVRCTGHAVPVQIMGIVPAAWPFQPVCQQIPSNPGIHPLILNMFFLSVFEYIVTPPLFITSVFLPHTRFLAFGISVAPRAHPAPV